MGARSSCSNSRFHMTTEDIVNEYRENSQIARLHILVTGATSGIGTETARALACAGAKVYLMGRDKAKLQDVIKTMNDQLQKQQQSSGSVKWVVCDLNSLASVKQFAQEFNKEDTPLHVLILNAGICNNNFAQTVDCLEQVMGVNHIGHAYLTQLLMPKLRALDCFQELGGGGGLIFFGRHSLQIFTDSHFYRKYWCTIT
jgi:NAD(P)-dependent dehydrogenase (short-subunit alcohol dehydrogenase family)